MSFTRKPATGADKGKLPTGYSDKYGVDGEMLQVEKDESGTDKRLPIYTYADALDHLIQTLNDYGFYMYPSPIGDFCCWDVYRKSQLEIEGLKIPREFYYQKQIHARDPIARNAFLATVRVIAEGVRTSCNHKQSSVWDKLVCCFEDDLNNPKNPISRIGQSRATGEYRKTTLNGSAGAFKVCPKSDWFPESVRSLDARKLLTLFPDAEAKQLMLILGRAMAGATGTETAEGLLMHTSRSYGLIVGHTAGMGKSTLLNYVSGAMTNLGYTVSTVSTNDTRFGWGEVACSDIAILDDLTDDIQRRLLHDAKVKTIVSNGWMKVEEKGQNAVSVKASTVFLWATNTHNPSHYIGMDEGSLSRLNQLDTYAPHELARQYPNVDDARILPYWKAIAKELGTTTEVLAMWLLRESLDYFMECCGYDFDGFNQLQKAEDKDTLETTIKANRAGFRIAVGLSHAEELTTAAAHLVAMAMSTAKPCDVKKLEKALERLDFNPDLLLHQLRIFTVEGKALNHPKLENLRLNALSASVKKHLEPQLADLERQHVSNNIDKSFTNLVEHLKSTNGFRYPKTSAQYQPYWMSAKRLIPMYIDQYRDIFNDSDYDCDPVLSSALDDIVTMMKGLLK